MIVVFNILSKLKESLKMLSRDKEDIKKMLIETNEWSE